ncbi:hypothetical protein PR048_026554 [Dryococelus australis]|uniref:Reverse transcriptase n=1 Tax=Dryococelus australis TaxID=614101 RepID=A0ABQ9GLP1_9NEOP|nr:hypothetical protein PR048_026554 [Dryococelus australis]
MRKQLQWFMGQVNWLRNYVPDFATITVPLTDILSQYRYHWTDAAQNTFDKLTCRFRECHLNTPRLLPVLCPH